jgi:hypothetical protein
VNKFRVFSSWILDYDSEGTKNQPCDRTVFESLHFQFTHLTDYSAYSHKDHVSIEGVFTFVQCSA